MPESEFILAPHIEELLAAVGPILSESGMVLVGGTALALQLNHRRSIDLDFFGEDEFDPEELFSRLETELRPKHSLELTGKDTNTLSLLINDVKVDILRHRYPAASAPIDREGIRIASLADISAMKLNAITNRGAKKDFYDVYYLLQRFSLEQLLEWHGKKYRNHDSWVDAAGCSQFQVGAIDRQNH